MSVGDVAATESRMTDISEEAVKRAAHALRVCVEADGTADMLLALRAALTASGEQLAMANEALAACQAQAAGRIRELEGRLRAARFDDEIDDGDMDDEPESDYCECGALHSDGTEEMDSGRCSACGGLL